jgi:hypothetical protein
LFVADTVLLIDPVSGEGEVVSVHVLAVSEENFPGAHLKGLNIYYLKAAHDLSGV